MTSNKPLHATDSKSRTAAVKKAALKLFNENDADAEIWLNRPCPALGNRTPYMLAATEKGLTQVLSLITRLEHGVHH